MYQTITAVSLSFTKITKSCEAHVVIETPAEVMHADSWSWILPWLVIMFLCILRCVIEIVSSQDSALVSA